MNLTYSNWERIFKPVLNHLDLDRNGIGTQDNTYFEDSGEQLDYVVKIANSQPGRVWTVVQGDLSEIQPDETDEETETIDDLIIISGYHLVNRQGYYITEKEVPADMSIEVWDEDTLELMMNYRLSQLDGRKVLASLMELTSWYQIWNNSADPTEVGDPDITSAQTLLSQFGMLTPELAIKLGDRTSYEEEIRNPYLLTTERYMHGTETMEAHQYYVVINRMGELGIHQMGGAAQTVSTFCRSYASYRGEAITDVCTADMPGRGYSTLTPNQEEGIREYLINYYDEYRPHRIQDGPKGKCIVDQVVELPELGLTLNISTPSPFKAGDPRSLFWHCVTPF